MPPTGGPIEALAETREYLTICCRGYWIEGTSRRRPWRSGGKRAASLIQSKAVAVPPKGNKVSSADLVAVVVGVKFWVKARLRCQTAWPKNGHVVQLSVKG